MADDEIMIFPLGDSALTVEFGNSISRAVNNRAIAFANHLKLERFPGFVESAAAYSSATIFYDLVQVRKNFSQFPTAFDAVKSIAEETVKNLSDAYEEIAPLVEIPVYFDAESALDLFYVAEINDLEPAQVIEIFTSKTYRVFMLGFLPGFTYMGEVDGRIATPRKESPRTLLPKGSVGIAGKQTGIYSLASPGGWQIIGRTDVEMFTPSEQNPALLQAGDEVRFYPVS